MRIRVRKSRKVCHPLSLFINYASSIPAIVTCLPYGTLSDQHGRKKMIFVPLFGAFVRTLMYTLVVVFRLNLNYLFIGSVVDGLCGSYHANSLLPAAVVADMTTSAGNRALSFAVIECIIILSSSLASLSVGYFIQWEGYVYPTAMMTILIGLSALVVLTILPETLQENVKMPFNPLKHLKKVVSFYTFAGTQRRRNLFRIGALMFFINIIVSLGRSSTETLYQLNKPFCWNSVKIGIFSAIQSVVQISCSIIALRVLKMCQRLETIGLIALVCTTGGYLLEGLATEDLMLYFVPVIGLVAFTVTPITRALMSRMATASEQGALFASLSVVDAICGILWYTLYNSVYIGTLSFYRGTVFFVMAGVCGVNVLLFSIFRCVSSTLDEAETARIVPGGDSGTEDIKDNSFMDSHAQNQSISV